MVCRHVLQGYSNRLGGNVVRQTIHIKKYWTVHLIYNIPLWEKNSGFTHSDMSNKTSVVAIGRASTKKEFLNTLMHELKHLQSHICKYYNVKEDDEDAAYLIGYLTSRIYPYLKLYI